MTAEILHFPTVEYINSQSSVKMPPHDDHKYLVCHECHSTKLEFVYVNEEEWLRCGKCYEVILFPDE